MKSQKTILIVEDEISLRDALCDKLTHDGFLAYAAKNGEEGLSMAIEKKPDLILLDIVMPVMGGVAMLKELRKDEWGKKAKVMMLTNLASDADKLAEVLENDVTEYLVKASTPLEEIVGKIKNKLNVH